MLELHEFMVAISRIEVDHGGYGGTAPDPMILDKGSILKARASSLRVVVDHASLPGPPGFLDGSWCSLSLSPITQEDLAFCPYSVSILLEFSSVLATLHLPKGVADLGSFGSCLLCSNSTQAIG